MTQETSWKRNRLPRKKPRDRAAAERRGRRAEAWVALWLRLTGHRVLASRYRGPVGGPLGEIDLIVRKGGALIAVEVKARADLETAISSVTARQRQRIARSLRQFQAANSALGTLDLRVDLVAVLPWRLPIRVSDIWHSDRT
jgi:putative endonuclease